MSTADPSSTYRAIENLIATHPELVDADDFAAVGELARDVSANGHGAHAVDPRPG